MKSYSFCESVTAGVATKWHIRSLTSSGKKLGGGADTKALCGREVAWDLRTDIAPDNYHMACKQCADLYQLDTSKDGGQ